MPTIHWFRRDLRLADNPSLVAAVEAARRADDEVVAMFVVDPALWAAAGAPRLAYLARSLHALDEAT
ncbi:deoxyribodipyrimidine photo-lyase, partial [Cellulomonas septica]|nr:deoxyribodipyrimidine photo-lyase [Cellulomonas septica]